MSCSVLSLRVVVLVCGMMVWMPSLGHAFDLSQVSVPKEEIFSGGPPKDGIPALTDPEVIAAEEAAYLKDQDRVIGVVINAQARAYPIRILNWHEIVNDQLGGKAIVVTYCPLCGTGIVFEGERGGRRTEFGVSGFLYNSNVLLYDRETESLWSQLKMEAISGKRMGESLEWLSAEHTIWSAWRKAYPQTTVLSLPTGYNRNYDRDPYTGYEESARLYFPVAHEDARLSRKAWVAGVLIDGRPKAYPLDRLPSKGVINDTVYGHKLQIVQDIKARSVRMVDSADRPIPVMQVYWFAWVAFYPETLLYGEKRAP